MLAKDQSVSGQDAAPTTASLWCDVFGIDGEHRELAQALFKVIFTLLTTRNRSEKAKAVHQLNQINSAIKTRVEAMEDTSSKLPLTSERLVSLLRSSGLSQVELAEKIGVTQSNISEWIRGTRSIPQKHAEKVYKTCIDLVSNRFLDVQESILGNSPERRDAA